MTHASPPHRKPHELLGWVAVAALGICVLATGFFSRYWEKSPLMPAAVRFTVDTPDNGALRLVGRPVISPDGQSVLFAVIDPATGRYVWYQHTFATKLSRVLKGTEEFSSVGWSYDSRSVILRRSGESLTLYV